jgi:UDP:flavonoid glycosyltransferase YjiC (YdhE family)
VDGRLPGVDEPLQLLPQRPLVGQDPGARLHDVKVRAVLPRGQERVRRQPDLVGQHVVRRVAAVVHHGGAGTTTTAALAGAPQVLVPQIVDQPHWARRVAELGIGAAHGGPVPTSVSLASALEVALSPETGARATAVAAEVRRDGALRAARLLREP